jgi:hypothetical protein
VEDDALDRAAGAPGGENVAELVDGLQGEPEEQEQRGDAQYGFDQQFVGRKRCLTPLGYGLLCNQ